MPEDYESLYRQGMARRLDQLEDLIKEAIERFDRHNNDLTREMNELRVSLRVVEATLRIKAGIWGSLASLATAVGMILLLLLTRVIH